MDIGIIEVKNVTKSFKIYQEKPTTFKDRVLYRSKRRYQLFQALNNITLTIKKGDTVGLVGRNGSGKSTLLKLLTGILYPDQGDIQIEGKISSLLELGAGFHPDFTGKENIFMNASILGLTKKQINQKLKDIITFSELEEYIDNPVRNYSSGMYMRLAFSVAIMVEPDVLLVDEILAVGDSAFQKKCMDQLILLKNKGTTIVFVSHDLGTIQKLCDRAIWINKGNVVLDATPKEVVDEYLIFLSNEENNRLIRELKNKQLDNHMNNTEKVVVNVTKVVEIKEAEVKEVRVTDEFLNLKLNYLSGNKMILNIDIEVYSDIPKLAVEISIYNINRILCFQTNNIKDSYDIDAKQDNIVRNIQFVIESLNLVSGTYFVDVSLKDDQGKRLNDNIVETSFNVSSLKNEVGIVSLEHGWNLT